MKKALFFICTLFTIISYSQTKVGTANTELIVGLMPETKKVLTLLNDYGKRLDSAYQIKIKEYQDKVASYQKLEATVSKEYQQIKLKELTDLEDGLKKSRATGNQLVQLKRNELMRPLYKKLSDVISEIAKEQGYTQILTSTGNEFAYIDEKYDITKLIIDKLGIKPEEDKK